MSLDLDKYPPDIIYRSWTLKTGATLIWDGTVMLPGVQCGVEVLLTWEGRLVQTAQASWIREWEFPVCSRYLKLVEILDASLI